MSLMTLLFIGLWWLVLSVVVLWLAECLARKVEECLEDKKGNRG